MNKEDCDKKEICLNSDKCWKCYNQHLLKLPKTEKRLKRGAIKPKIKTKRPGSSLEHEVKTKYDNVYTGVRNTINSGALWFDKGDVSTPHCLNECKDQTVLSSTGKKNFTILRQWLEDIAKEAAPKYWCLPFRYAESTDIYVVKSFDQELAHLEERLMLIETIKVLEERLARYERTDIES